MPKKIEDAPCDGCGIAYPGDRLSEHEFMAVGHRYCPTCAEARKDDPAHWIAGRSLTESEMERQADDGDEGIKSALTGIRANDGTGKKAKR